MSLNDIPPAMWTAAAALVSAAVAAIVARVTSKESAAITALEAALERIQAEVTHLRGEVDTLRTEVAGERRRYLVAARYIGQLIRTLTGAGMSVPTPPHEIAADVSIHWVD